MKYFFLVFLLISVNCYSQLIKKSQIPDSTGKAKKLISKKIERDIEQYLVFNSLQDTISLDTTLSIQKEYKFNYLRKDNFNLIAFANTGQTYNTLSFDYSSQNTIPLFSAQARHFNYMTVNDINYYNVPTPLTELYYKTVFTQGQNLDAFFTINTSKQFNFSLAYKGLRSIGKYQNALTSTGNFRFTTNFKSKNEKYNFLGHVVFQDLLNQENGGLSDEDIIRFSDNDDEIGDRSVFDPLFDNAESNLEGRRFHMEQSYSFTNKTDSIHIRDLKIINSVSFEDKFFQFNQTNAEESFFGSSFNDSIKDKVNLSYFYSDIGVNYKNSKIGDLSFNLNYNSINYGYNSLVTLNNQTIANRIKESFFGINGSYNATFNKFNFNVTLGANLSKYFKGSFISANLQYSIAENTKLSAGININEKLPNYNFLLNQSSYENYNWDNQSNFETIKTQQLSLKLNSNKIFNLGLDVSNIKNHTYFNLDSVLDEVKVVKPKQTTNSIQYIRARINKEFKVGKFSLDNTLLYQTVSGGDQIINVPTFVTRNALYYTDEVFKKALKFQTGIVFNYFSEYKGNGYDPLLAEFYTQTDKTIGGFPRLDFFINAKVRQTRIFLKAEHFNSSLSGYNYLSAPNYPYRDFTVRFGLVWNFFL